jgi:hypothetical protein
MPHLVMHLDNPRVRPLCYLTQPQTAVDGPLHTLLIIPAPLDFKGLNFAPCLNRSLEGEYGRDHQFQHTKEALPAGNSKALQ